MGMPHIVGVFYIVSVPYIVVMPHVMCMFHIVVVRRQSMGMRVYLVVVGWEWVVMCVYSVVMRNIMVMRKSVGMIHRVRMRGRCRCPAVSRVMSRCTLHLGYLCVEIKNMR